MQKSKLLVVTASHFCVDTYATLLAPLLLLLILGSGVLSLGIGTAHIPPHHVLDVLIGKPVQGPAAAIVHDIRLPRLVLAILIGAALAVSGAAMQGFFQNPMADPYIVGVSSGAASAFTKLPTFTLPRLHTS